MPRHGRRDERRRADGASRTARCSPPGRTRRSPSYTDHGRHDAAGHHRRCASKRCPIRRCRRGGPGRDGYGHFRVTGLQVEAAPRRRPRRSRSARARSFKTIKVDDSAVAVRAGRSARREAGRGRAQERIVGHQRDARHRARCRATPCSRAKTPFGFADGTRITVRIDHLDGTIGQGIGRFRLSATTAADPLEGADFPPRLRPVLALPAAERTTAQAEELAAVFRVDGTAAEADTGRARRGAKGAGRSADSLDARDEGARLVRAAVVRAARPRQLHGEGRARLRRHAGGAAPDARRSAGQPARPRPMAGRREQPARRARRRQPPLGADLRPRPRRDQRGLRHARRAARRIRSCSTGWRPSSSRRAGARRRSSARS